MKTKEEIQERLNSLKKTRDKLSKDIDEMERLMSICDYRGKLVKVIDGGYGCRIADGEIGKMVDKPINKPHSYSGRSWPQDAEAYFLSINGRLYGLCKGFELAKATERELTEQFLNK